MSAPILAPALAGQTLGSAEDGFVIAEWRDAGGPPGPPRFLAPPHVHFRDDEAWYVLEGTLHVQAGEQEVVAHAGSAVFVPRGTPHTYWNPGEGLTRYLLVMTPNIFRLIQAIHALEGRTPAKLAEVFQRHDSQLVDLPPATGA